MVNYPNHIRRHPSSKKEPSLSRPVARQKTIDFANRGMTFEAAINDSNRYYLSRGLAVIHKKPTPVQIVKVDYPKRSRAKIVEAYFRQASTTDYSGVYKGHYIDFEAKETQHKTSIPMKNFHPHQVEHMEQVLAQDGVCFVLLHFSTLGETYLLPAEPLIRFYRKDMGGKSMPLSYIREYGYPIQMSTFPSVPYLETVEHFLLGGNT